MKEKLLSVFKKLYYLKDKIAFFPTIIAIFGCLLAYFMIYLETRGISNYLLEYFPELVIDDVDTARTILSTFIGGLISMMVFSFSMVMILLNQASNNFSPRLLPGLISNRRHQIILGTYIGTIIYCIFILVFIEPTNKNYTLPGFSVIFSILLIMVCLSAFIYFIHSISQEIQINVIMDNIVKRAKTQLEKAIEYDKHNDTEFPETDNWKTYTSRTSGYFQIINKSLLKNISKEHDIKIDITLYKGGYCFKNTDLFKVSKEVDDDVIDKIYSGFTLFYEEKVAENFNVGFKHLMEIVLKAMSPGINDPGTAIYALDYLSELFVLRIQKDDINVVYNDNDEPFLRIQLLPFNDLLHDIFISLKTYCKHDFDLVKKMINILKNLHKSTDREERKKAIEKEVELLLEDAKAAIDSKSLEEELTNIAEI